MADDPKVDVTVQMDDEAYRRLLNDLIELPTIVRRIRGIVPLDEMEANPDPDLARAVLGIDPGSGEDRTGVFRFAGSVTGRMSSRRSNFQVLPRTELIPLTEEEALQVVENMVERDNRVFLNDDPYMEDDIDDLAARAAEIFFNINWDGDLKDVRDTFHQIVVLSESPSIFLEIMERMVEIRYMKLKEEKAKELLKRAAEELKRIRVVRFATDCKKPT